MRTILKLSFSLILFLSLFSLCLSQESRVEPSILIKIPYSSSIEKNDIIKTGIDVIGAKDDYLKAIVTPEEKEMLSKKGYNVSVIADDYRSVSPFNKKAVSAPYHDYTSILNYCTNLATAHPDFIKLYTIGKTKQNRDIIAVKITDNPNVEEAEPEVRLAALHHGNELSGSEFSLYLMKYITDKYTAADDEITSMVNTTEIWILPMVNPDGMMKSGGPNRYNANGYDLNRNYLSPIGVYDDHSGPYPFSEKETQAVKSISCQTGNTINNSFVIGITYHSGEDCFNYVWNYTYTRTPDNSFLIYQGNKYKDYVWAAGQTTFWVTDGADWYITNGDLNDWSYYTSGTLDTTLEMTDAFIPSASTQADIDAFCLPHLRGTLFSIWLAGEGIIGKIVDGKTGNPVVAKITVNETSKIVYNDPTAYGDFYINMMPGTYSIKIEAAGYEDKTIPGIICPASTAADKKRSFIDLGTIELNTPPTASYWMIK